MGKWIFLVILSLPVFGKVLKYDITGYKRAYYSYKEVCTKLGLKELLLVDYVDALHLDCMGTKISVKDFCLQENKGHNLLRGYVNPRLKEVTCQYGSGAFVSIACDKRDKYLCAKPKEGCERLNKTYALSHKLVEYSLIEKDVDNVLNCMYQQDTLSEIEKVTTKILMPYQEKKVIDRDIFSLNEVKKEIR